MSSQKVVTFEEMPSNLERKVKHVNQLPNSFDKREPSPERDKTEDEILEVRDEEQFGIRTMALGEEDQVRFALVDLYDDINLRGQHKKNKEKIVKTEMDHRRTYREFQHDRHLSIDERVHLLASNKPRNLQLTDPHSVPTAKELRKGVKRFVRRIRKDGKELEIVQHMPLEDWRKTRGQWRKDENNHSNNEPPKMKSSDLESRIEHFYLRQEKPNARSENFTVPMFTQICDETYEKVIRVRQRTLRFSEFIGDLTDILFVKYESAVACFMISHETVRYYDQFEQAQSNLFQLNQIIHRGCYAIANASENTFNFFAELYNSKLMPETRRTMEIIDSVIIPNLSDAKNSYIIAEGELTACLNQYAQSAQRSTSNFNIKVRKYKKGLLKFHHLMGHKLNTSLIQTLDMFKTIAMSQESLEQAVQSEVMSALVECSEYIQSHANDCLSALKELLSDEDQLKQHSELSILYQMLEMYDFHSETSVSSSTMTAIPNVLSSDDPNTKNDRASRLDRIEFPMSAATLIKHWQNTDVMMRCPLARVTPMRGGYKPVSHADEVRKRRQQLRIRMLGKVHSNIQAGKGKGLELVITRWGSLSVCALNRPDNLIDCYLYDYGLSQAEHHSSGSDQSSDAKVTAVMKLRKHDQFTAPEGAPNTITLGFTSESDFEKFKTLSVQFTATHAPFT